MKDPIDQALKAREALTEKLLAEGTNAYRLFHGVAEGIPGLTIDRYGSLILIQTFREPLAENMLPDLQEYLASRLPGGFSFVYNHRGKRPSQTFDQWHQPEATALGDFVCTEFGVQYLIRARHPGIDPWLFLDLRCGRRFLRGIAKDKTLLNLFSYTCSVGLAAVAAGASEAWNVDFAMSNLAVGRKNAALNQIPEHRFRTFPDDCLPVMRQLAGLPAGGRHPQKSKIKKFEPRQFDIVFLDPPAWSKSPFGAVDVVGDYPGLFKPALLAAKSGGGRVIATHHVPSVSLEGWLEVLRRCAIKAGKPIQDLQTLTPEADFPSFDGKPPLKIAVCTV